jgi:predicted alpha/beta hydrolase family esterase
MKKAFIIHGAYGHPEENWIPWLKAELEKNNYEVHVPTFPTPENQNLKSWREVFQPYEKLLNESSILIGHSIGVAFILDTLERISISIKASFLISGFIGPFEGEWANPDFDLINQTFTEKKFDWETIKRNCRNFYIYHSDNDPYVPMYKAEEIAAHLNTKVIVIQNAGHFNEKAGYLTFEELLNNIKSTDKEK